jgi:hypothetical protein
LYSPEEAQGFQRATGILTAILNAGHGWQIDSARPWQLRWDSSEHIGLAFALAGNVITPEKVTWLYERGWIAEVFRDLIIVAPIVPVRPPKFCFHSTPSENAALILQNDLVTGSVAGRSTSNRPGCGDRIYVSFDLESAREWTSEKLLGKNDPSERWAILRIASHALNGPVCRDPASATGYILEDRRVAREFLELVESRSVRSAPTISA